MEERYEVEVDGKAYSIRDLRCVRCGNDLLFMLEPPANPGRRVPFCGECNSFINGCVRPIHRGRRKKQHDDNGDFL